MLYARQETDINNHAGHGGWGPTSRQTSKTVVDDIVDWCGRPLPDMVRLTADREEWRMVTSLASTAHKGHELRGISIYIQFN